MLCNAIVLRVVRECRLYRLLIDRLAVMTAPPPDAARRRTVCIVKPDALHRTGTQHVDELQD